MIDMTHDRLGLSNVPGQLQVYGQILVFETDGKGTKKITLDGNSGDILLSNGDCAEEFEAAGNDNIEPGELIVLETGGRVRRSTKAYDRKVAGVVSGAGNFRPAIILDRRETSGRRVPVALMGKVYCRVDATSNPVEVGDMLTSSDNPGHAMKATDPDRAFGSVIGKALQRLDSRTGLVSILVALH